MQLRWAPAAEDLFRIIEYIRQENPLAAQRIAKTIYESAGSLKSFPNKGRKGHVNFPCHRFPS
jgi:plasmid stabilization system protein ParE